MITDRKITVWSDVYGTQHCDTTVGVFLSSSKHRQTVDLIRRTEDKVQRDALKKTLPQAAISGTFENGMGEENLAAHSGLVCIDIDQKDNPAVSDWQLLRKLISRSRFIGYLGLSASGHGLWGIVPIAHRDKHREQFAALEEDFRRFWYTDDDGLQHPFPITIDHGYISVCHKRAFSYDAEAYLNEDAEPYERVKHLPRPTYTRYEGTDDTLREVQAECDRIKARGTDITANFEDWTRIGFALATLGEQGRQYYHELSSLNPRYRQRETDKKYNNLLRTRRGDITIRTFFELTKNAL